MALKCINEKPGRWPCNHACVAPIACASWGYCRQRNIDAGGMANVTPAMQAQWREEDGNEG